MSSDEIVFPYTHTFAQEVDVLGDRERSITLREPTTGDLIQHGVLDGTMNAEQLFSLVAELSGWPPPKVKKLPGVEGIRLSGKLSRFFASVAS